MGGGGIDDFWFFACQGVDQRDRLARRIIVQTQHYQVRLGHQVAFSDSIFAQFGCDAQHLDRWHGFQAFTNLQAGGACFAINKNFINFAHMYIIKMS